MPDICYSAVGLVCAVQLSVDMLVCDFEMGRRGGAVEGGMYVLVGLLVLSLVSGEHYFFGCYDVLVGESFGYFLFGATSRTLALDSCL